MASQIRNNANDVNGIFSSAGYVTSGNGGDEASGVVIQRNPHIKIGMWNVRTMMKKEKIETLKMEMKRNKINILGLSETRWKDTGDYVSEGTRVIYSGVEERQSGVAVILDESTARNVIKVTQHNDRLMLVKAS